MRTCMVPSVVRKTSPSQPRLYYSTTRVLWESWATLPQGWKRGTTPLHHLFTDQGRKRDKGMRPSSSNGPASHPGGERHQQNLDSNLADIHHSPFSERRKCNRTTGRFLPNLRGAQYLSTHFLMPRSPSRTHPGDTRSLRTNSIIATPLPHPQVMQMINSWWQGYKSSWR